jgi:hypothetical protein
MLALAASLIERPLVHRNLSLHDPRWKSSDDERRILR